MIAIDFETYLISEKEPIPRPVCLSYYRRGEEGIVTGRDGMEAFLLEILKGREKIIAHNMRFEALVIDEHFKSLRDLMYNKFKRGEMVCTKVNEQLLNNARKQQIYSFSLAGLVKYYFDEDISEDKKDPNAWRLRYSELDGVPLEEWPTKAVKYAIDDSIWAFKVYEEQLKLGIEINAELSVSADFYLNKMGLSGILIDKERVKVLEKELLEKLNPKYQALETKGLVSKQLNGKYKKNMIAFRQYLQDTVKKEALEYTAKGSLATSGEALTRYLESTEDRETIEDYLDIMKYEKILTAFVSRLKKADPYIYTNYNAVVSSGRTSSSTSPQYASVNIQQMPRGVEDVTWDIRNCFVPREGFKIVSIDYAGLELTSTANQLYELLGGKSMLEILNRGEKPTDMHSMLAYRLMNMKEKTKETYESFLANKKKAPYKNYRQLAKPINLGFPGGIGYDTMRSLLARDGIFPKLVVLETSQWENQLTWKSRTCRKEGYPTRVRRISRKEYQLVYDELVALKEELFDLYPDLRRFLSEKHEDYLNGDHKMIKNEFGEWEKEPMYKFSVEGFNRDYCMYTQVCNGLLMQSPSAIGAKKALVRIMEIYGNSEVVRPLAFIHDEIVFEVKDDKNLKAIIKDLSVTMCEAMQEVLKHVRVTVEAEVFDYWAKAGGSYSAMYWEDPKNG